MPVSPQDNYETAVSRLIRLSLHPFLFLITDYSDKTIHLIISIKHHIEGSVSITFSVSLYKVYQSPIFVYKFDTHLTASICKQIAGKLYFFISFQNFILEN